MGYGFMDFRCLLYAMLLPGVALGTLQDSTDSPVAKTEDAPTSEEMGSLSAKLPRVHPRTVAGFEDDVAFRRDVERQIEEVVKSADTEKNTELRIRHLLSGANLILARLIAPACTSRLLGIPDYDRESERLRGDLERADSFLQRAESELETQSSDGEKANDPLDRIRGRAVVLSIFARALRVSLLNSVADDPKREFRRAASKLSRLLEDEDPGVAASAGLWQASLRSAEGDPSRALSLLDPASADLAKGTMPYAFFARLLRCRLVSSRGGYAAALAMLMQIEERCEEWFPSDEDRADALRTAQWVQLRLLAEWHDALDAVQQKQERQWCADRMETLLTDSFSSDGNTVLRLSPGIPLIFPLLDSPDKDAKPKVIRD